MFILHPKYDDSVFQDSVIKNLLWKLDAICKVSQKNSGYELALSICFIDQKDASKGLATFLSQLLGRKDTLNDFVTISLMSDPNA